MVTKEQKTLILEFVTDWIAQFPNSSLISIKYSKNKRKLDPDMAKEKYTHIQLDFDTPDISKGRVMRIEVRVLDLGALDCVHTALSEQTEAYLKIDAHKAVGFKPMSEEKLDKWEEKCAAEFIEESREHFVEN